MKIPSLLLTVSALTLATVAASAGTYSFNGDTTGALTFNRPTEPGDLLSDIGTAVPYYALSFLVTLSGNYNFTLLPTDPDSYDSFLHLYSGSFNLGAPLDNFLAANDDAPGGSAFGSALSGVTLTAGNTYVFVADGFSNSDFGTFSANISGPGDIAANAVPEPSFLALGGLAGLGLLVLSHRQARR